MDEADLLPLLPDMAAFVQVIETGGFSAAARKLGVTPSAVTRQVQRLERALSIQLIERSTRRLRLTEAGEAVLEHCRDMTLAASAAVMVAGRVHGVPRGLVRISAPVAYGRQLIDPLMAPFLNQYPEVDVQLLLLDRAVDPIAEGVDLVIRITDTPPPESWAAIALQQVQYILCASPGYLEKYGNPKHPKELQSHDCLHLGESREDMKWPFISAKEKVTMQVRGRYLSNESGVRRGAALAGLGIACLPDYVALPDVQNGNLVQVLKNWRYVASAYAGTAWLMYPPNRLLPPKTRALQDYLVDKLVSRNAPTP